MPHPTPLWKINLKRKNTGSTYPLVEVMLLLVVKHIIFFFTELQTNNHGYILFNKIKK